MFFLYNSLQQTGGEGQTPAFWMNKWPETAAGAGELWRTRRSQWEQFFWHQLWCTVVLSEWNTEWKRDVVWSTYWDGKDAAGYSVCLGLNSVSTINAEPRCGSAGSCGRRLSVDCLTTHPPHSHTFILHCVFLHFLLEMSFLSPEDSKSRALFVPELWYLAWSMFSFLIPTLSLLVSSVFSRRNFS